MCHSWGSLQSGGRSTCKQLCQLLLWPRVSAALLWAAPWAAVRELPCQPGDAPEVLPWPQPGSRLHCRAGCCSQGQSCIQAAQQCTAGPSRSLCEGAQWPAQGCNARLRRVKTPCTAPRMHHQSIHPCSCSCTKHQHKHPGVLCCIITPKLL